MAIAVMPELTQEKLQEIARTYFRELLVEDNDPIFWIEDMFGNSPDDRTDEADSAASSLRQQHQDEIAAGSFKEVVARKLAEPRSNWHYAKQ